MLSEIFNHIQFIKNNQQKVIKMIEAKIDIVINKLNRKEVLREFANILLKYVKVYQTYDWKNSSLVFSYHEPEL